MQEDSPVIIDNGTFSIKSGFVSDECPKEDVPNLIGYLKYPATHMCLISAKDYYVGQDAWQKRGVLGIKYPVVDGLIANWQNMQKVWQHMYYNELRISPTEHPTILIQSQRHSAGDRQKIAQLIFETFQSQKFYFTNQYITSLHHNNKKQAPGPQMQTGIIINSSHQSTQIVPIVNSQIIDHAVIILPVGGFHVEEYFQSIYKQYQFKTSSEKQIMRHIKETVFQVAIDPKSQNTISKDYFFGKDLSQYLAVGSQRFQSCEVMFNPELLSKIPQPKSSKVQMGLHEAIMSSIMNVDESYHSDLLGNIVLNGGNMTFPGMVLRLQKEIEELKLKNMKNSSAKVFIRGHKQTRYTSYTGAQKMSCHIQQNKLWLTKQQYDEVGPNIMVQQNNCPT